MWFRQHYRLAPTDTRFLEMDHLDIKGEYWAYKFFESFQKGKNPGPDWFDTDLIDAEINRWAEEDREYWEIQDAKRNEEDWEEVVFDE